MIRNLSCVALAAACCALLGCGTQPAPAETGPDQELGEAVGETRLLVRADPLMVFAWRDPASGCQYVTTSIVATSGVAVSTIPRTDASQRQVCGPLGATQ